MRRLTPAGITLIGTCTRSPTDRRATVAAPPAGAIGKLERVEERTLSAGAGAFADLDAGRGAAAGILLRPH